MERSHHKLRALCEAAVFVAFATILSLLPVGKMPQGGSFDLAMLPLFIFFARWGFGYSLLTGLVYGIIQMMLEGGVAIGWQSILGDYLVAYTVLGAAGLFARSKFGFFTGVVTGCAARFAVHLTVGATVWADYMPPEFFDMTMTSPWLYSALYNGSYMLVDMLLCLVVGALLYKPLGKYLKGEDIK